MAKSHSYLRWDRYPIVPTLRWVETGPTPRWEAFAREGKAPFKRKCRAVIYHRASGQNDPLRVEQIRACREYCDRNGFPVYDVFKDIKPADFDMRAFGRKYGVQALIQRVDEALEHPGYDQAVAAIKEGRADILVVYSPDQVVFQPDEKHTLAYQLCYIPPVAFVEPWQDEEEQQAGGDAKSSGDAEA